VVSKERDKRSPLLDSAHHPNPEVAAEAIDHQGEDRDALLRVAARYLSRALWGDP
jgi:hypothetical protein